MPALDFINKTAEVTHDISASATSSATAVNMGRKGLVKGLHFAVEITALSAADLSDGQIRAYFEYTTDNGSTWRRGGVIEMAGGASGIALQLRSAPVDIDIVPEQNAPDDIDWRVTMDIGATEANADDFSWVAYLTAGPIGQPSVID